MLLGGRPVPPLAGGTADARSALLDSVRAAVHRSPCLVSFSGGMDSSLVLAAATRVAREDGAADPIPVTWRIDDAPAAQESDWQDAVVAELGLRDWIRLAGRDDLDWIGPIARDVHRRHGLCVPPNAFLHDPLLRQAAGGALLTGVGGDQLFGLWRWRSAADVIGRRTPRTPRGLVRVAYARSPVGVRAGVARIRAQRDDGWAWLRPAAARTVRGAHAAELASEPPTWAERVRWQAGRRRLIVGLTALGQMAADHRAVIAHPLLSPGVVDAVARAGGRAGFSSRARALPELFGDLVPLSLHARATKATFGDVFARVHSRTFIDGWSGHGLDASLVDAEALHEIWRTQTVPMGTALLLQQLAFAPRPGR